MVSKLHVALLGTLFVASLAFAQTNATVSGTVTDPTGAHVVGAKVTAFDLATGVATPTATNEAGVYDFASLPPGKYRITAEHIGFRKASFNDIELAVGANITINLPLHLGSTTATVEDPPPPLHDTPAPHSPRALCCRA